ncbi:uncharacterized protein RCO7_14881 [Rhynchosporium graminicola]|uniref:Uncharacterized protein n=1 Tax=Rhynchosporium graminicola TaxID=2792576 RepID=A0A1E1L820_9HELO|nr:uncharacterized protein RCO7_14881 [Rhynchosporium commune]
MYQISSALAFENLKRMKEILVGLLSIQLYLQLAIKRPGSCTVTLAGAIKDNDIYPTPGLSDGDNVAILAATTAPILLRDDSPPKDSKGEQENKIVPLNWERAIE